MRLRVGIAWRQARRIGWLFAFLAILLVLPSCQKIQTVTAAEAEKRPKVQAGEVRLLSKSLARLPDGSVEMTGHWTAKEREDPIDPEGKWPIATQRINSTMIRCWPTRRICEEYRAVSSAGVLVPLEPMRLEIVSWDDGKIIATMDRYPHARILFHIDADSEQAEMEYRREPSPDHCRLFERWVLE
jgi:hypothetical protein